MHSFIKGSHNCVVSLYLLYALTYHFLSHTLIAEVPRAAFSSLAHIVNRIHELKLTRDKHNRDCILCSYVQYVFSGPQGPANSSSFDPRHVTALRSRSSFINEDDGMRRSSSLRQGKHAIVSRKLLDGWMDGWVNGWMDKQTDNNT